MTLDPLLAKLNQFTTPHDLSAMIETLYKVVEACYALALCACAPALRH